MAKITSDDVKHLASLAKLPISTERQNLLVDQIETTFEYIETAKKTDTKEVSETNQITGLTNVWREDEVDEERMFTQAQALANVPQVHDGFVMVRGVLEQG